MKRLYGLAILAILAIAVPGHGYADTAAPKSGTYILDKNHGKITWSIDHLGYSTYIGQFTDDEATLVLDAAHPEKSTLDVTVHTDSVGTLNPTLDEHLKSAAFFNVAKFPTATFKATRIKLIGSNTAKVRGDFTLLGVTKPVTLLVTLNKAAVNPFFKDYEAGFTGVTHIKRSEFGLTSYLPLLGDDVSLNIEGEFKLQ